MREYDIQSEDDYDDEIKSESTRGYARIGQRESERRGDRTGSSGNSSHSGAERRSPHSPDREIMRESPRHDSLHSGLRSGRSDRSSLNPLSAASIHSRSSIFLATTMHTTRYPVMTHSV